MFYNLNVSHLESPYFFPISLRNICPTYWSGNWRFYTNVITSIENCEEQAARVVIIKTCSKCNNYRLRRYALQGGFCRVSFTHAEILRWKLYRRCSKRTNHTRLYFWHTCLWKDV